MSNINDKNLYYAWFYPGQIYVPGLSKDEIIRVLSNPVTKDEDNFSKHILELYERVDENLNLLCGNIALEIDKTDGFKYICRLVDYLLQERKEYVENDGFDKDISSCSGLIGLLDLQAEIKDLHDNDIQKYFKTCIEVNLLVRYNKEILMKKIVEELSGRPYEEISKSTSDKNTFFTLYVISNQAINSAKQLIFENQTMQEKSNRVVFSEAIDYVDTYKSYISDISKKRKRDEN